MFRCVFALLASLCVLSRSYAAPFTPAVADRWHYEFSAMINGTSPSGPVLGSVFHGEFRYDTGQGTGDKSGTTVGFTPDPGTSFIRWGLGAWSRDLEMDSVVTIDSSGDKFEIVADGSRVFLTLIDTSSTAFTTSDPSLIHSIPFQLFQQDLPPDNDTRVLTVLDQNFGGLFSAQILTLTFVPEPGSLALLGLGGLLLARRERSC